MEDDFKDYDEYYFLRQYPDAPDHAELAESMDGMQLAMGSRGVSPEQSRKFESQTVMENVAEAGKDLLTVGKGMADIGAATVKGRFQGFGGLPGDIEMIGRGVTEIFNRGGGETKVQAFLRGMQENTILPTTEDIKKWLDKNVGMVGAGDNPYETIGEITAPGGYVKNMKAVAKGVKVVAKEAAPIVNKMAEDYMRKTGLTMAVAPDSVTKQVTDLMPRVDSIERFPLGPTSIKPKVIAPDVPLYREMDAENLTDFLRNDRQFAYSPAFVTDNPDLAIGQGSNKGVKVKFRPNSISGEENVKPMTGAIAGREYRADVIAPRAIESITFANAVELKKVRPIAANVLKKDFERVTNGGKEITFVRKMQPQEKK